MPHNFNLLSAASLLVFINLSVSPGVLASVNSDVEATHLPQQVAKSSPSILVALQVENFQEEAQENDEDEVDTEKDDEKK